MPTKQCPENPGQDNFTINQPPTETADNSAASQRRRILDPAKPESRVRHVPLATSLKRAIVHAGVRGDITPKAAQKLLAALNLQEA